MRKPHKISHAFQVPEGTTKVSNWVYWFLLACVGIAAFNVFSETQSVNSTVLNELGMEESYGARLFALRSPVMVTAIFLALFLRSGAVLWCLWLYWLTVVIPHYADSGSVYSVQDRFMGTTVFPAILFGMLIITALILYLIRRGEIRCP